MAKKKGNEASVEASVERPSDATANPPVAEVENREEVGTSSAAEVAVEESSGLVAEVQSFLSKRSELAEKLAREIEATEKKLAELKRTASLLSPLAAVAAPPEPTRAEKKPKKLIAKKPEKPRRLLDNVDASAEATAEPIALEDETAAKSPAEEMLVTQS